jgi:hypothetical protein
MFDVNQSFHVIQPHATSIDHHFCLVVSFLWAVWSIISRLVAISGHFRLKSNNLEDLKLYPYFPIFELFMN